MSVAGRHDSGLRRKAQRRGRERGCWVYIAAEQLAASGIAPNGPVPHYRIWSGERGRFIVTLYPEGRQVSWPSDGGPRYIVRETWGYDITARASAHGARAPSCSVVVMDRAYCHRVRLNLTRSMGPLAARQHLARARAEHWEALHLAALSD